MDFGLMYSLQVFHDTLARTWDSSSPSAQPRQEVDRRSAHSRNSRHEVRPLNPGQNPNVELTCASIGDQFARWTSASLDTPLAG